MSEYIEHDQQGISVGIVKKQYVTVGEPPHELVLDNGSRIGPLTIAYETYGQLDSERRNAILICHALSGDAHVAGYYHEDDPKPGWWDIMVGPGKAIDTDKYFVVCSNILGSCMGTTGPSSIDPGTGTNYGLRFPVITIGDMVKVQMALMNHLGIERILSVIGGSIGGLQVLEWCVSYPERVVSAIPLATTAKHSALTIAFNEVARQAIMADPNWQDGDYYSGDKPDLGLALARMIGHITYLSDEAMRKKFGRRLQDRSDFSFIFNGDFQIESYLRYQGKKFVERFDANSFLYITKAADYYDLGYQHGQGSLVKALSKARSKFLVISFTSDWLYPTYQSRELVKALKKNGLEVSFCEIEAEWGHDAFLLPNERLSALLEGFLERGYQRVRKGN